MTLSSHAFQAETASDEALQCAEQELLCDSDPTAGQSHDRVHAVRRGDRPRVSRSSCSAPRTERGEKMKLLRGQIQTTWS